MSSSRRQPSIRVLGIDPGSEVTGYGVIDSDGQRHTLVEYAGVAASRKGKPFTERLLTICVKLDEVIARLHPQVCAVESSFYAANVKSALTLGQVRGAILVTAARAGLPVFEYSPLEIKSALVGYGRAEKSQVQEMVRVILHLTEAPLPHDASDALAAAICHLHNTTTLARISQATRA